MRSDWCCVYVELMDWREIGGPIDQHKFLRNAPQTARDDWEIDALGLPVYWPQLQHGLEVPYVLDACKLVLSDH